MKSYTATLLVLSLSPSFHHLLSPSLYLCLFHSVFVVNVCVLCRSRDSNCLRLASELNSCYFVARTAQRGVRLIFFPLYFCLPSIHDYTHKYVAKWRVSVRRRIDRIHYINYMYMYGQFICQCRDHCGFRSLLSYSLVLACIVHCVRAISCFCAFKKKTEWNSVCDGRFCGLRLHCAACKRSCSVHRNPHPWPGEVLWTI